MYVSLMNQLTFKVEIIHYIGFLFQQKSEIREVDNKNAAYSFLSRSFAK